MSLRTSRRERRCLFELHQRLVDFVQVEQHLANRESAQMALVQGLRLSPDKTEALARRIEEWIRTRTSIKGRETL